ncbi:MAG: hypothetical protein FWC47_11380, partial [Oscillospiraceae bacterium]|nr:hypothetical protein [Oscillospiraceae bacterium]
SDKKADTTDNKKTDTTDNNTVSDKKADTTDNNTVNDKKTDTTDNKTVSDKKTDTTDNKVDTTVNSNSSSAITKIQSLKIIKSVDETAVPGETIKYEFVVKNAGDTNISNVTINIERIDKSTLNPQLVDNLAPGEEVTFTANYTVHEDANISEKIKNTAIATGRGLNNTIITSNSSTSVITVVKPFEPAISVLKSVNNTMPKTGDTVTYTITVKNTGNSDLKNINVVDEALGYNKTIDKLNVKESKVITLTKKVTEKAGSFTNSVKVSALNGPSAEATATYCVYNNSTNINTTSVVAASVAASQNKPGLSILKTVNDTNPKKGDTIMYTIMVKNTGNIPITNIKITDEALNYTKTIDSLDVGKYAKVQITRKVSEKIGTVVTNTVTATADGFDQICSSISYTVSSVDTKSNEAYLPLAGEEKFPINDFIDKLNKFFL